MTKVDFDQTQAPKQTVQPKVNPLEYHGADEAEGADAMKEVEDNMETAVVAQKNEIVQTKSPKDQDQKIEKQIKSKGVITTIRSASDRMESAMRQSSQPSSGQKIGRNDPCVCGSGKKYKKCCGR
ncbi:MAG: SEC-C metal-binding domain-containing protein [Candidatus Berkelbacteria bacterium]|nr:SEC-C metal-binding domain-containing protein [Candidatus Berkelbacteria bacterium]